jgi:F-type H+-transporting ATPase subunit alpha
LRRAAVGFGRHETAMLAFMRDQHGATQAKIRDTRDLGDEAKGQVVAALDAFAKTFA